MRILSYVILAALLLSPAWRRFRSATGLTGALSFWAGKAWGGWMPGRAPARVH